MEILQHFSTADLGAIRCKAGSGAEAMVGTLSEQKLARSVAHRLKYYIDVRRREDSFDSSGVIADEAEKLHLQPACLTKQKRMKEHDLAKIKLEASLRAYMGNVEDCTRKVLKNPEKQKDLEKSIKKMAQDYLPDRKYEHNVSGTKRPRTLRKTTFHLRVAAVPSMSPEELQRLVSSASKLIVAATSEIPREERATEGVPSPRRSKTKSIQSLYNLYKDEARRAKQERKNAESIKRITDASNIPSNSAKSNTFPLQTEPTGRSLGKASYLPTGEGKVVKKSILKSRTPPSPSSSLTISEHQEKQPNVVQDRFPLSWQNAGGRSPRPLKVKWGKSSHRGAKMVSRESGRSSKCRDARPFRSVNNNPVAERNDTKPIAAVSGLVVINEEANLMHDHLKSKQAEDPQKNRPRKDEQSTLDLVSEITPECHPMHLRNFVGGIADGDQGGSDNCSRYHLRGDDAPREPASVSKPRSLMTCASAPVAKHGSCFLYEICQEMDQESPSDLMTKRPTTIDEKVVNQTAHCLLTPLFSLNDPDEQTTVEDSTRHLGIIPGKAGDRQDVCGPPVTSGRCRCLELLMDCVHDGAKDQNAGGCPVTAPALPERSGSEQSEEEFTTSSASSSLSATSLINLHEQMNGNATDENADFATKVIPEQLTKPENLMPENQTPWLKAGSNNNEKQRSSGEKRRARHYRTADTGAGQIVYFSQFPKSF